MGLFMAWAARWFDWLGLVSMSRVGLLSLCLIGAAVLYFAVLLGLGVPLRELMRRGRTP
jgi:hypothetical protein